MAIVIAGMTTSLDGFVADAAGSVEATGAVVMGRRAFDMADPDSYVGNYEFQVPIFVVTHHPPEMPPKQDERLTFTFVTDGVQSAIDQARTAAGDKAVQVIGGASLVQQLLRAGLVDQLNVDVMPVMLGGGLRLLENIDPEGVRLEKIDVREVGARTSLRFRILNQK